MNSGIETQAGNRGPGGPNPRSPVSSLTVSAGASGAVFRHPVVEIYRIPVLATAVLGIGLLGVRYIQYIKKTAPALQNSQPDG